MREVVTNKGLDNENTIWQEKDADKSIETEMLYRLMVYLGSNNNVAKEKIKKAVDNKHIITQVSSGLNGFSKLQFNLNKDKTWDAISWAIDKLGVDVEDRDKNEYSFYLNVVNDKKRGIMSKIFGDDAIKQNISLKIKQINNKLSEVYFVDIGGINNNKAKELSDDLFYKISQQF
jgi:outer membrane protein assembly factor BamC